MRGPMRVDDGAAHSRAAESTCRFELLARNVTNRDITAHPVTRY